MKKNILLKTILLTLSVLLLALVGCKDKPCNHSYDNTCDAVCNTCSATRQVDDHVYDNACDVACNECNATRAITHDYSVLQMNETHHWYICSVCEREDGENKATHTGEATCQEKAKCTVCETLYSENHTGTLKYKQTGAFSHNIYYSCCDTVIAEHVDNYNPMACYCNACEAHVHILSSNCRCSGCDEYFHTIDETCLCLGCYSYLHSLDRETGICNHCNQLKVDASIVINGVKAYYATLDDAILAANGKDCTIIIENNCQLQSIFSCITSGNIVVDLNGKVLSSTSNTALQIVGGTVTVCDSVGGGEILERIFLTGGTLIVESGKYNLVDPWNDVTVKVYGGEISGIYKNETEIIKLYGGSFEKLGVLTSTGTLADLLPVGYCFYDENGKEIDLSTVELDDVWMYLYNVTVGQCLHDYSVLQMDETHHWYACSKCEYPNEESKITHTGRLKYGRMDTFSHNIYYSCCDAVIAEHVDSYEPAECYCRECNEVVHVLYEDCSCCYCQEYFHTVNETCFCLECSGYFHDAISLETGICADCNQFSAAVSVVIDGVKTYYTTLDDGIYAANGKDCTIIIENNCQLQSIFSCITSGNIVVDLNGKIVSGGGNASLILKGGTVTLKDSVGGGEMPKIVFVRGGNLIIENGKYSEVQVSAGATLTVYGGEISGIYKSETEITKLYGGSFKQLGVLKRTGTLADLLPVGYCFYDENGKEIDLSTVELDNVWMYLYNVTVGEKVEPADVTIALKDGAKVSYYWADGLTIDLSTLLNITDGAGEATYTLTSSKGSINGSMLNCPLVANYTVTVTTAETATHKAGTFSFTITVESDPNTGDFDGEWVALTNGL